MKTYLLKMTDEQHEELSRLSRDTGLSIKDLLLSRTLGALPTSTPPGFSMLEGEVKNLRSSLNTFYEATNQALTLNQPIGSLQGAISQAQAILGGEEPSWQQQPSPEPVVARRSKRSSR